MLMLYALRDGFDLGFSFDADDEAAEAEAEVEPPLAKCR